jgi:hypothetical protein
MITAQLRIPLYFHETGFSIRQKNLRTQTLSNFSNRYSDPGACVHSGAATATATRQ